MPTERNMKNSKVSVVSSYARDTLVDERGNIISSQEGGPLIFIKNALEINNVPHELFYGPKIEIEILVADSGEFGKLASKITSKEIDFKNLSDWTIISTLSDEWRFNKIKDYKKGKIFVDIQGYVRDGNNFGGKKFWEESQFFNDKIFCMKGTREELCYLPEKVIEDQKKRLLIITDGEKGVEIHSRNKRRYFNLKKRVVVKNTIGAGDTFLGSFIAKLFKGYSIEESAIFAQKQTSIFLQKKI